jgi:hypothetical protein
MYKENKTIEDINSNAVVEAKKRKDKWIFNILGLKANVAEPAINVNWDSLPTKFIEKNGKIYKLKEFDSKKDAITVGIEYHKFLKEVFSKPRISKMV